MLWQKANKGQQLLSANSYSILYMAIPALEYLQTEWEKLQDKYTLVPGIWPVLQAGLDKLAIYYLKMESLDAYAISMSVLFITISPSTCCD